MATVIDGKGNEYLFTFSSPETEWIIDIAKLLGITKEAVLGAAMNKGLIHYYELFCKEDAVDRIKDRMTDGIKPDGG